MLLSPASCSGGNRCEVPVKKTTFGTYKNQPVEWLVLHNNEGVLTLISRHVFATPLLADENPKAQDKKITKWLNNKFLAEIRGETPARARLLKPDEAKILLEPDERCAYLQGMNKCEWWHLASSNNKFAVVSDSGDILYRSFPYLGYVRPVIDIYTGENA